MGYVGLAFLDPGLEFTRDGSGEQHDFVEMRHASNPSRVGVRNVDGFLGGDVENSHIFNVSLRVGKGVIDVLSFVVVVVVLQVDGQFGQRPVEHITERLGLKVELEEVNHVAVPQHEVLLPSGFELAESAGKMGRNGPQEIKPADGVLVVDDEVVLLLAVLGVLARLADVEVAAETVEHVVALLLVSALVDWLVIEIVGRVLLLGLVVDEAVVVVLPWFLGHSALAAHLAHSALIAHVRHLIWRVVEGAGARLEPVTVLTEFAERFLSSSLHQLLND